VAGLAGMLEGLWLTKAKAPAGGGHEEFVL